MTFLFTKTAIEGVLIVTPQVHGDDRGFFMETYTKPAFESRGIRTEFVQHNHSRSVRGVIRGLHFQREPLAQAKLVRCTRGSVFDVAVDIRRGSPTYGQHLSLELSESAKDMLYIPRGFAHGFLTTSDIAEVEYIVDNPYSPSHEGGFIWNDPALGIPWPIRDPILSERDKLWPKLGDLE